MGIYEIALDVLLACIGFFVGYWLAVAEQANKKLERKYLEAIGLHSTCKGDEL